MNILAFDTSASFLNAALQTERAFFEIHHQIGLTHSEHLLTSIDQLLSTAAISPKDLDLIVCSRGPGSFTGLRIGMSTAKGLSAGTGAPLISIPSLDVYAADAAVPDDSICFSAIDARKRRYYTSVYEGTVCTARDLDISAEQLIETYGKGKDILITGPDAMKLYTECTSVLEHDESNCTISLDPSWQRGHGRTFIARGLHQFEELGADLPEQGPLYIRKSEAELSRERKQR